ARVATSERFVGDVTDQRVGARATLDREDLPYGVRIGRVGAQAVDRLGGKRDQPAAAKHLDRSGDLAHEAIPSNFSHAVAASASEQIRKTSCTVPVPVYRHFSPDSVGYCTLKLAGVLPRRTLIRPGTIRVTCGQFLMMRSRIASSPPTRPCWRLIRPNFIAPDCSAAPRKLLPVRPLVFAPVHQLRARGVFVLQPLDMGG